MPSVSGSSCLKRSVFDGRLPGNTLCGASVWIVAAGTFSAFSSARASAMVRPRISASLCARQLARSKVLVAAVIVLVRPGGDEEIARDDVGALVDELVEGVLAVGAGLAEDDRPGRAHHGRARRA